METASQVSICVCVLAWPSDGANAVGGRGFTSMRTLGSEQKQGREHGDARGWKRQDS